MTERILQKLKEKQEEEAKKKENVQRMKTESNRKPSGASSKKEMTRNMTVANIRKKDDGKEKSNSHNGTIKKLPPSKSVSNFNRTVPAKKNDTHMTPVKPKDPKGGDEKKKELVRNLTVSNLKSDKTPSKTMVKNKTSANLTAKKETDKDKAKDKKDIQDKKTAKDNKKEDKKEDKKGETKKEEPKANGTSQPIETPKKEEKAPQENPKTEPKKEEVPAKPKIDYVEILSSKWDILHKFFNSADTKKIITLNKKCAKMVLSSVKAQIEKDIPEVEKKFNEFKDKNKGKEAEFTKEFEPFKLAKGAMKAIDLLKQPGYFKTFQEDRIPERNIILVYRFYFQIIKKDEKINELLKIENDSDFWKAVAKYFLEDGKDGIGLLVEKQIAETDFSDININKLSKMCVGYEKILTPSYFSKICPTTGLFIFLVKEALEYIGALIDRKTSLARIYKNYTFEIEHLKEMVEKINKSLEKLN